MIKKMKKSLKRVIFVQRK